jgi:hypothetical protein
MKERNTRERREGDKGTKVIKEGRGRGIKITKEIFPR